MRNGHGYVHSAVHPVRELHRRFPLRGRGRIKENARPLVSPTRAGRLGHVRHVHRNSGQDQNAPRLPVVHPHRGPHGDRQVCTNVVGTLFSTQPSP